MNQKSFRLILSLMITVAFLTSLSTLGCISSSTSYPVLFAGKIGGNVTGDTNSTDTPAAVTQMQVESSENLSVFLSDLNSNSTLAPTSSDPNSSLASGLNLSLNLSLSSYSNTAPIVGFLNTTMVTNRSIYTIEWFSQRNGANLTMAELYVNGELVQRKSIEGVYSYLASRELKEGTNTILVLARDSSESTNSTSFNFTLDMQSPSIELLPTIYPKGVNSAKPGDEVILKVRIDDIGTGIDSVELYAERAVLVENSDFYRYAWDSEDANYLFKVGIPKGQSSGNYSIKVTATDKAGNIACEISNITVKYTYSSFNIELMPGWNIISLPLIPDNSNPASLFNSDIIESVWSYDSSSKNWKVYNPGPAPDTLTELKTGVGYIILTNSSKFTKVKISDSVEATVPIKINYSGKYLVPGQVPPTYTVKKGWNLIGFHSEENMTAEEYLAGLTYPARTWTSLITYNNNVIGIDINKITEESNTRLQPGDYMQPGKGYWVYAKQDGVITP